MKLKIINLSSKQFIAAGAFCECYQHPKDNSQCIKIPTDNKKANKRLKSDLSYYKKLHRRNLDLVYIADFLGTCETNMGSGYIFECICNDDRSVSKTLEHYLEQKNFTSDTLWSELHQLGVYLLNNLIIISDIHARNILIQYSSINTSKPMIVDGIGDRVGITILNILKSEVRSKIIRRWNRFVDSMKTLYPHHDSSLNDLYISKTDICNIR